MTNGNGIPAFVIDEIPVTPVLDAMESQTSSPRVRVHSTPGTGTRPLAVGIQTSQSLPPTQHHPLSARPAYDTSFGNRANPNGNGWKPPNHSPRSRTKSLTTNVNECSLQLRSPLDNRFSPQQPMLPLRLPLT